MNDEGLDPALVEEFRSRLRAWYRKHARVLPWRGVDDPYRVWISEVMLQQTRVVAVVAHYERFLELFPTILSLALASEEEVLAAWSGLGYYRRARMLHLATKYCVRGSQARLPESSAELRMLPGIGEYTCAAIASIAYGEAIAVVDGNVERVLLRVAGRAGDVSAKGRRFVRAQAAALVPAKLVGLAGNAAGDHNQAMMELGATICLPRNPLCLNCPVYELCRTRGEHGTVARTPQRNRRSAHLLATRRRGSATEVLLERRAAEASIMPGMLELPPLLLDGLGGHQPILRVRHSITNTNYAVEIYAEESGSSLREAVAGAKEALCWVGVERLRQVALTGLARKVLRRVHLMVSTPV